MQPQAQGCYLPQLITPTQLGLFVDSTPSGGAGVREEVEGEGGARGASEGPSDVGRCAKTLGVGGWYLFSPHRSMRRH